MKQFSGTTLPKLTLIDVFVNRLNSKDNILLGRNLTKL